MASPRTSAACTVVVSGPDVASVLADAWALHLRLCAGDWSALADATVDRWVDVDEARAAFTAAAQLRTVPVDGRLDTRADGAGVFVGPPGELCVAVDTWQRVQLGQFHHPGVDYAGSWVAGDAFLDVRVRHCADGAWPAHRHASWGIHSPEVPDRVRVAYDIWKLLGGGIADRGVITGTVTVEWR
jgi:hypothetical protein